jgi:hypothetical protein
MSESLCGIYYGCSSWLILLKRSPHCGSITLDLVLSFVLPKAGGWIQSLFVDVLMRDSTLGVYSNYLAVPREQPSPVSYSFGLGALD